LVRRGWFLTLSVCVSLALIAVLVFGYVRFRVARSRLPERGLRVENVVGCPAGVSVRFDARGIPHVRTDDEEGLWFAQGYVHARDRFFQMELARRLAAGRLAEVLGAQALVSDRKMRTWRLGASARRQAALLDGESRAVLEAYSAGVNAALDRYGGWIAPEIWLLGVEPEPWRPESSLEVALLLQLDLSWSMGEEFQRAIQLSRLGRERAVEMWGWSPSEARSWIPPGNQGVAPREQEEPIRSPLSGVGSNSWALAPDKTATGRTLLATDPHLGVLLPGPFAMIHLRGPGLHVAGASLPGTPGVLIGHNEHVAWSFTMAMLDDQDLFALTLDEDGESELVDGAWVPLRTVTEEIEVRWQDDPVLLKIRMSEHGPLVRDTGDEALALAWSGFSGQAIVRAMLSMNRAVSAADAALAWDDVIGPSMNLVAADTGGHIVHQVVGRVPDRGRGAGRLPAPGADSRWKWKGFLPMRRNPHTTDPEEGFLATANHDFFAEGDYPMRTRLPGDFASPWRVRRIRKALAGRDDWDVSGTLELQRDVVSDRAIAMLKQLRPDLENHGGGAARVLLDWDGRMAADSVAPHVFSRLMIELGAAVGSDELSSNGRRSPGLSTEALMRLLAGGMSDAWWDDTRSEVVEDREQVLRGVLDTLDQLEIERPWGEVHQVFYRHPFAEIPVAGRLVGRSWNRGPFPVPGDNVTIDANYWSRRRPFAVAAMPALRFVVDVGDWDETVVVMPLGQSGRPWSSHYADQIRSWRNGRTSRLAFSESAVQAATEAQLVMRPTE
jgi:penicillin amidase